jgi:outer membrane phospholipase A
VGDKGFKTDSLTLGWHLSANNVIPFYVRAHFGPMNTLSNYTERQNSIGIGVRFDADYESTKVR